MRDDIQHAVRVYLQAEQRARRWPSELTRRLLERAREQLVNAARTARR